MKLFPSEHIIYETKLTPEEVHKKIQDSIEPKKLLRFKWFLRKKDEPALWFLFFLPSVVVIPFLLLGYFLVKLGFSFESSRSKIFLGKLFKTEKIIDMLKSHS